MNAAVEGDKDGDSKPHRGEKFVRACSRGLRSPALAVILFLALAVLSAVGTVTSPPGGEAGRGGSLVRIVGLERTFSSPLFLALVVASILNVAVCTLHRLALRRRTRSTWRRSLTDVLLHGSLLLVFVGAALKGALGFVGTQNVYVGEGTDTVYDWRAMKDAPLGFHLRVEEFQEHYYPVRARIGLRRAGSGEKLPLLEVVEGGETSSQDGKLRMRVVGYDQAAGSLRLAFVTERDTVETDFRTREPAATTTSAGGYDVVLAAYRADLRAVRARVTLAEAGAPVQEGWLTTNDRLRRRGTNLFLTAWGVDSAGRRFCGIQVVRDPGAPVFWAGCILLALAVPAHLLVKGRGSGRPPSGAVPEAPS